MIKRLKNAIWPLRAFLLGLAGFAFSWILGVLGDYLFLMHIDFLAWMARLFGYVILFGALVSICLSIYSFFKELIIVNWLGNKQKES